MSRRILLASRGIPGTVRKALRSAGAVRVFDPADPGTANDDATVLMVDAMEPVRAALIRRLPDSLGLIANLGVGVDNIDLAAARAAGIQISNTPVVTEDTADLAMALVLATCRRLSNYERLLRASRWEDSERPDCLGTSVHGKTLGIIGFGAIGQALARRAQGFSMPVLYHGPRPKPDAARRLRATYCEDLAELLARSDVVSLNCPLRDDTRHIIDADRLRQMKGGAVLINTGRGPLVDESALVDALASGHLGGAGLDVFEFEPKVSAGLTGLTNVTLLPHIGSATVECRASMHDRLVSNVIAFLESGHPVDIV